MSPDQIAEGALRLAAEVASVQQQCADLVEALNRAADLTVSLIGNVQQLHSLFQSAHALNRQHRKSEARKLIEDAAHLPPLDMEPIPRFRCDWGDSIIEAEGSAA